MIPAFESSGLLPPGIHQARIEEFEQRFVVFDRSDRRFQVYAGLKKLLETVRKIPFITRTIIAGSFVSRKAEPNDFDCLLVLDGTQIPHELNPFEYRVVSRRAAAKDFKGDVVAVVEGSGLCSRYFAFFQTTRDGTPVGMVELIP